MLDKGGAECDMPPLPSEGRQQGSLQASWRPWWSAPIRRRSLFDKMNQISELAMAHTFSRQLQAALAEKRRRSP